ncbi:cingulin-like protein 1 isoform X2 [Amborella trichopoda]|uniref:cingulin-like protein 1 isoform X2 n=1 Tax=Amborella trichopoda TaxID=13333 RepID=UPI0009BCFBBC|nr:cingulin-like protein 1 isoform X2 [Amborella trichopoda]|eukprot:XP_020518511.1 cingulin-like protein 1 isoform X2 [Amborella trichopoda]
MSQFRGMNTPSITPEGKSHKRRSGGSQKSHATEKLESSCSSRSHPDSSGTSPYLSPVPLRCRSARLTQATDKVLDLYIDGEYQDRKLKPMNDFPVPKSSRPPRSQSSAPISPVSKELPKSLSFREPRGSPLNFSSLDFKADDVLHLRRSGAVRPSSKNSFAKNVAERLYKVLPGKSSSKSREYDRETSSTVEDIFEDYSESLRASGFDAKAPQNGTSEYIYSGNIHTFCSEEVASSHEDDEDRILKWLSRHDNLYDPDDVLLRKGKEAEERVRLLSKESEHLSYKNNDLTVVALLKTIRQITEDRRNLAIEVAAQIHGRLAERASANQALKQAKVELDSRTRRLEKEKNELQMGLERELDRRSTDWSSKLEKYKTEEKRLRERLSDLAEQNVSLQREVLSQSSRESESKKRIINSEIQLNEFVTRLEEANVEITHLQQALTEAQACLKQAEEDRDFIKRSFAKKEREVKDLQKAVIRLQRLSNEQEKSISGLRQGLSDELGKDSLERESNVKNLLHELARLTGMEQSLRRQLESCRIEVESLRQENIALLERLQDQQNGGWYSLFKLDRELHSRVDALQNQGLLMLKETIGICSKLLEFTRSKHCHFSRIAGSEDGRQLDDGGDDGVNDYQFLEFDIKVQSFKRETENFGRSLQMVSGILQDVPGLLSFDSQSSENGDPEKLNHHNFVAEVDVELKAETLLNRALREKLCSKEIELEQLQEELSTSVRLQEILKCEVQRAQDAVSCLTHKLKELELQIGRKDEAADKLSFELQDCMKGLSIVNGILAKVTEEKDLMLKDFEQYKEKNFLLNSEVGSLKKKIEALEEDVYYKDGQITILKDDIRKLRHEILYLPDGVEDSILENWHKSPELL